MDQPQQDVRADAVDDALVAPPSAEDLAALIDCYQTPLLRYTRNLINSAADTEDVVQEAFLRLHRQVQEQGAESIQNAKSWLFRVAHNLSMDWRRRKMRTVAAQDKLTTQADANAEHNRPPLADEDLIERETIGLAMSFLDRLAEPEQQIIRLKVIEGLTLREIADVLGLSVGNVYYRLNQGLGDLARELKEADAI